MSKKIIYDFEVLLEEEIEETETKHVKNKETGDTEEVSTKKKVKKEVPYGIVIYEPSRRQVEEADMEFSVEMSKCIKRGILTKAMLAKKYSDSGGLLTEEDSKQLVRSYAELGEIQKELSRLVSKKKKTDQEKDKEDQLTEKFAEVRRGIVDLETAYQSVFNHTADTKAQNKTILWYIINLCSLKNPAGLESPLFPGEDQDEREESYYKKDEEGDKIYDLAREKIMAFISFWYFSQNPSREDFESLEKDMESGAI
tara:strand:- start:1866 stop:2630 length:765 start_codon:yes stop_codon:yes gene_type:complete